MHEVSMAQTILNTALTELKKHPGARLTAVQVVIGKQHAIEIDNLKFAFEAIAVDSPARGAKINVEERFPTGHCKQCGWSGNLKQHLYACNACGSCDLEVEGGWELYLANMEVETDD